MRIGDPRVGLDQYVGSLYQLTTRINHFQHRKHLLKEPHKKKLQGHRFLEVLLFSEVFHRSLQECQMSNYLQSQGVNPLCMISENEKKKKRSYTLQLQHLKLFFSLLPCIKSCCFLFNHCSWWDAERNQNSDETQ